MQIIADWESKSKCLNEESLYSSVAFGANEKPSTREEFTNVAKAKRMCMTCPVRSECLTDALNEEAYLGGLERHGIRGGLTALERLEIATQDPMCARCGQREVTPGATVEKTRTLCSVCLTGTQNDVTSRYFPPLARPLTRLLREM